MSSAFSVRESGPTVAGMIPATRTCRRLRISLIAAALVLLTALGGCADGEGDSNDSSPAQTFNEADVKFAQTMIPHHEQAIEMSDIVLAKSGIDPDVSTLAQGIKATQAPEMATMTGLLAAWEQPLIPDHAAEADEDHWDAEGVLTPEQMQDLMTANSAAAQRLYLEGMIEHHEGAITMVQDEIDGGENADAVKLAEAIKKGQTVEITTMKGLLARL